MFVEHATVVESTDKQEECKTKQDNHHHSNVNICCHFKELTKFCRWRPHKICLRTVLSFSCCPLNFLQLLISSSFIETVVAILHFSTLRYYNGNLWLIVWSCWDVFDLSKDEKTVDHTTYKPHLTRNQEMTRH